MSGWWIWDVGDVCKGWVVEREMWRLTARVGVDNNGERINGLDLVRGLVNYIVYAIVFIQKSLADTCVIGSQ
jgi:hypothetical protein